MTGETDSVDFPTTPGVIQQRPGKRHCSWVHRCLRLEDRAAGPRSSTRRISIGELDDAGARSRSTAPATRTSWARRSQLFPIVDAFQSSNRGLDDAFVVKLNADATRLLYSSYLGGSRLRRPRSTASTRERPSCSMRPAMRTSRATRVARPSDDAGAFQRVGGGVCDVSAPRAATPSWRRSARAAPACARRSASP